MQGIDINEKIEFIASSEKGKESPTIFMIGNISNRAKISLFKGATDAQGNVDVSKLQEKAIDIVVAGLKGIKNLSGKDYTEINEAVVDLIPFPVVAELVNEILTKNFVGEGEAKN